MIRQDYLLRMIEQAAQMVARLTGLQQAGRLEEAVELSRVAAGRWLGLDAGQLRELGDDQLLEHLQRQGSLAEFSIRLGLAIALLKAEGERLASTGDRAGAVEARAVALNLLLRAHILNVAPELPDFTPGISELLEDLPPDELPDATAVLLICYHEHLGQFGRAEDVLFSLKERHGESDWLSDLARQFYQRLLQQPDDALRDGNLPRNEVEEGLSEWTPGGG